LITLSLSLSLSLSLPENTLKRKKDTTQLDTIEEVGYGVYLICNQMG
jgi:hypothetical protein